MEIYEIENEVVGALCASEELMTALPLKDKAVFHFTAPSSEPSQYPIIVYSPISDVPVLAGDNREVAHRVTIRIHVIATQRRFDAEEQKFLSACRLVKEIMTGLGFVRRQTTPFVHDGKIMRILDFVKGVES